MPGLSGIDGRFSRDQLQSRSWADGQAVLGAAEMLFIIMSTNVLGFAEGDVPGQMGWCFEGPVPITF